MVLTRNRPGPTGIGASYLLHVERVTCRIMQHPLSTALLFGSRRRLDGVPAPGAGPGTISAGWSRVTCSWAGGKVCRLVLDDLGEMFADDLGHFLDDDAPHVVAPPSCLAGPAGIEPALSRVKVGCLPIRPRAWVTALSQGGEDRWRPSRSRFPCTWRWPPPRSAAGGAIRRASPRCLPARTPARSHRRAFTPPGRPRDRRPGPSRALPHASAPRMTPNWSARALGGRAAWSTASRGGPCPSGCPLRRAAPTARPTTARPHRG